MANGEGEKGRAHSFLSVTHIVPPQAGRSDYRLGTLYSSLACQESLPIGRGAEIGAISIYPSHKQLTQYKEVI
jgi:hypothetical protein